MNRNQKETMKALLQTTRQLGETIKEVSNMIKLGRISSADAIGLIDGFRAHLREVQIEHEDNPEIAASLQPFVDLCTKVRAEIPEGQQAEFPVEPVTMAIGEIFTEDQLEAMGNAYPDVNAIERIIAAGLPEINRRVGHACYPRYLAYMVVQAMQETLGQADLDQPPSEEDDEEGENSTEGFWSPPMPGVFEPRFPLGAITTTRGALNAFEQKYMFTCLKRHAHGDWGDLDAEDTQRNDDAVFSGQRILSAYVDPDKRKLWIITEADRSRTTFLTPDEY
jgi:hypothetical protein